ncbi:uncharacterized protein LOC122668796 [Telopea speciosissima]|uniref:uncharacterized protein LOC122668796 n=1 Tax=Telopea speciosissima TaxID=54955 RepID=UPI001CC612AA|nr:uncharacterized protein LOC122668796 [Telopea speciosissima]
MELRVFSNRSQLDLVIAKDATSGLRGDSFFKFPEDRMLMGGDFDLNSGQHYSDSPEEVLKQTILHHETIFRNQVYELHRLYRIQKTLMKDLSQKEIDKYTPWTANTKSIPLSFQDPQKNKTMVGSTSSTNWNLLEDCQGSYSKLQDKPLDLQLSAEEYISNAGTEFPKQGNLAPTVAESGGTKEFLHANHVPDPVEVKLFLSSGGVTSEKGFSSRSWYNKESSLSTLFVIDSEESIERKSNEEVKPIASHSESPATFVRDKHGVLAPFLSYPSFSDRLRKDIDLQPFVNNHSLANQSGRNQENKSCCSDTGLNECQSSGRLISLFTSKRISSSCDKTQIDLNRVQLDESSCFSNDPLLSFPFLMENSPAIIRGLANDSNNGTQSFMTSRIKTDDSFSDETSTSIVLQQDNFACSALKDCKGKFSCSQACDVSPKCGEKSGYKGRFIDLEHEPEDLTGHWEYFCNQDVKLSKADDRAHALDVTHIAKVASNQLHTSLRCTVLPQAVDDAEVGLINFESSEEDTLSSGPFRSHAEVPAEHCKLSDATSKTNCWTSNNSCYIKDLQSEIVDKGELENSKSAAFEETGATQLGSQVTENQSSEGEGELENSKSSASEESGATLLGSEVTEARSSEQETIVETGCYTCACTEERLSDGTKKEHQCHSQQKNVVKEMDILILKAAESLIQISLDNPFCPQDCFGEAGSNALEEEMSEQQPEYSSDSFESITLRLTECSADDYLVKSMPVDVNETPKGSGWKLKRGSRLKDFQKDILPGLVSLSRHEICEDINIIGAVLRSKEYRNRSKNIGSENWSVPVKRRRSKLNFIGRRIYN